MSSRHSLWNPRQLSSASLICAAILAVTVGALSVPVGLAAPIGDKSTGDSPDQAGRPSTCACVVNRDVGPASIRECETGQVTVTLQPTCPGKRIHIVYIIDEVYKVGYSEPRDRFTALRTSVDRLELRKNPHISVGVVWMQSGSANMRLDFTNETTQIISRLDPPVISRFDARPQCFECGFREANRMLDRVAKEYPDEEIDEIVLLAPLGVYTSEAAPGVTRGASQSKARPATVISTCFAWTHCDVVLRRAASEPRLYLAFGEGSRLAALLEDVVRESKLTFLREATLFEKLPPELEVVPGSFNHDPTEVDAATGVMRWELAEPYDDAFTLTYQVRPLSLGTFPVGIDGESRVVLTDSVYREVIAPIPAGSIIVSEPCLDPPTATPPLPTSTPTNTPTDVPAPTDTPPPTATAVPSPIYLPIAVRERCRPDAINADVVLVLDASSSMLEATRSGRTKLEAAKEAVGAFIDGLDLEVDERGKADQAAIVYFNGTAELIVPLGRDRAAMENGLAGIETAMTTRLDLGIERGAVALAGPARDMRNTAVMIVLTDGRANPIPVEVAAERAEAIKAAGVRIYTVGLGDEVEVEALRAMASESGMYRGAPDGDDLSAIYEDVTEEIACGDDPFWPSAR